LAVVALALLTTCSDDDSSTPPCYTVTADTTGMGTVQFSPDAECYGSGTVLTLTAVARAGWAFDSWSGDTSSTANPLVLTITGTTSLTATFVQVYTLTVNIVPSQSGTVTLDPDQAYYLPGDDVILTAEPNVAYGFSHWVYGTEIRDVNPITIVFGAQDEVITAMFGALEGEPDCADEYVDFYNGGCNSVPEVFQNIADGQIYLARSGLFIYQTSSYRDTDWFRYVASDDRNLTFTGIGEFPLLLFIIDGSNGCANLVILVNSSGNPGDTVTVTAPVGPGIYWMWGGPSVFTGPWPCPQDYKVWFTAEPAVGAFSPTAGRQPLENELSNVK